MNTQMQVATTDTLQQTHNSLNKGHRDHNHFHNVMIHLLT